MNIFFVSNAVVIVLGLLVASYTDVKERIVSNKLSYSLLFAGLFLHVVESIFMTSPYPLIYSISSAFITFIFSLVLYKLGAWAGGDVKLFTALGALVPLAPTRLVETSRIPNIYTNYPLFPFLILENSVVIAFPFIMTYVFWKTFSNKKLKNEFKTMLKNTVIKSVCLSASVFGILAILSLVGLPSWISLFPLLILAFLPRKFWYGFSCGLLVAGLLINENWLMFVSLLLTSLFGFGFMEAVIHGRKALQRRIAVRKLKEGMISAELVFIKNGKVRKSSRSWLEKIRHLEPPNTIVSDLSATGLTRRQIENLKKFGIKSILVKESIPLIPILLLGCIASLLVGDLVWLITNYLW